MSHTSLTYHIVFSTYRRMKVIDILHERELYKYIYDFSKNRGIFIRRIGGMPDHIHILCDIPAKIAVAEYVKLLKAETSKFLRVNPHFPQWVKWSE
ncbi:MAG: IS200/IS605 family transposase, partial [Duncaniella sp.]|nr:IS200/IS605 family transposase [Duncaniella sp.]